MLATFLGRAESLAPPSRTEKPQSIQIEAWQLFTQANDARAAAGLAPLHWDPALAIAAKQHCIMMALESSAAKQFRGESDLEDRAWQAGARFSVIQEDMAIVDDVAKIRDQWQSPRGIPAKWLDPQADSFGMAFEKSRGIIFAVADYAKSAAFLSQEEVEEKVANLLKAKGLAITQSRSDARNLCAGGMMISYNPSFIMGWQSADLGHLPDSLMKVLSSAHFKKAAVGSCTRPDDQYGQYDVELLFYEEGIGLY